MAWGPKYVTFVFCDTNYMQNWTRWNLPPLLLSPPLFLPASHQASYLHLCHWSPLNSDGLMHSGIRFTRLCTQDLLTEINECNAIGVPKIEGWAQWKFTMQVSQDAPAAVSLKTLAVGSCTSIPLSNCTTIWCRRHRFFMFAYNCALYPCFMSSLLST